MGVMNHLLTAWCCDGTQNAACFVGLHMWVSRCKKGIQMTESQHLLKQYAVTSEVSAQHWESMQAIVRDELERQLMWQTSKIGFTVISKQHRHASDLVITEDGTAYEIVRATCIATGYQPDENTQQTLRKLEIDSAQHEWIDEDE
jgi:hypothetical protein